METWVPLCTSVCVSQSSNFWWHTFIQMYMYMHQYMYTCPPDYPCLLHPMHSYMETWVPLCGIMCLLQSSYFCFPTLFWMCSYISTWIYVHQTAHVYSTPMHSLIESWVPTYGSVFVSQSPDFCSDNLFRMCTCRRRCGTRWGVTDTLTLGPPGAHMLAATMWRGGADLGSQVDMPACADACTHYNQGVETDELWMQYADGATQGWTGMNTAMLRGWVGLH